MDSLVLLGFFCVEHFLLLGGGKGSMEINAKEIGQRIKKVRMKNGLTQPQFAEIIGTSYCHVSRIEPGIRMASLDLLATIATTFDVTLDYLILGR